MNIGGFEWPDYIPLERGIVKPLRSEPTIAEACLNDLSLRRPGIPNFHDRPIVDRLVRMIEELLERDHLMVDHDTLWYRNRLKEIKAELNAEKSSDTGTESEQGPAPAGKAPSE